jgi:hypothetical protein
VLASAESVKLAQDLGVAAEQAGHKDHQESDDDGFDDDQGFHHESLIGVVPSRTRGLWQIML